MTNCPFLFLDCLFPFSLTEKSPFCLISPPSLLNVYCTFVLVVKIIVKTKGY